MELTNSVQNDGMSAFGRSMANCLAKFQSGFLGVLPSVVRVIFNNPATIVFWSDGEKTVVKCFNEEFDPEKGLAMAISKRYLGFLDINHHAFFAEVNEQCRKAMSVPDIMEKDKGENEENPEK